MAETYHFGEVTVEIDDGLTVTRLPDGGIVPAEHREQPGQAELAQDLGYATAEEMNREHDMLHSLLSHMLGLPASPTLQGVGNMRFCPYWREEEAAVFALTRFAKLAGVDLVEVARRYST